MYLPSSHLFSYQIYLHKVVNLTEWVANLKPDITSFAGMITHNTIQFGRVSSSGLICSQFKLKYNLVSFLIIMWMDVWRKGCIFGKNINQCKESRKNGRNVLWSKPYQAHSNQEHGEPSRASCCSIRSWGNPRACSKA